MTEVRLAFVDVYVLRGAGERLEVLALKRSTTGRCAGSWETVHGTIEAGETPVDAAQRELREETGFVPERFYNVSRVESFYQHHQDQLAFVAVFAAFVSAAAEFRTSSEHERAEWLSAAKAATRFAWPRERRAIEDIVLLFRKGDGGLLEDVLRVC